MTVQRATPRRRGRRGRLGSFAIVAETEPVAALLQHAVEEVARLVDSSGAMLYLFDDEAGDLRFAHEAGIADEGLREAIRTLRLRVGEGIFGRAVLEGRTVLTGDYAKDRKIVHAPDPDRFVRDIGLRSMIAAPLSADGVSYGALGAFSLREEAFGAADTALVRALAEHAATSIANMLLIERLAASERELARRADVERALREIAQRLTAITETDELLQLVVDEAARLLDASGARIELYSPDTKRLHWAFDSQTGSRPGMGPIAEDVPGPAGGTRDEGISGRAFWKRRAVATGDYLADRGFKHLPGADEQVARHGIHSAIAAPLPGEEGPLGTLTVYASTTDAYDEDDVEVVEALAGQAGIALSKARRMDALRESREENARLADSERSLREIAARITAIRDPSAVLEQIVREATRLLDAERAQIDLLEPIDDRLQWPYSVTPDDDAAAVAGIATPRAGQIRGLVGRALREGRIVVTNDYLADRSFRHVAATDAHVRRDGLTSVVAAPLTSEEGPLGVLQIASIRRAAFGEREQALVEALATQAAIAIVNSRRIADLARSQADLARRATSEQALRELAARLTAMHDPAVVLQDTVDEAVRVLDADAAIIDLLAEDAQLVGAYDSGLAAVLDDRSLREQTLSAGEGLSGRAIGERRPLRTGDYLKDETFVHTRMSDRFVRRARLRSMIAAPLMRGDRAFGTLEVFARRADAFDDEHVASAVALANQASIAIANARLIFDLDRSRQELEELLVRVTESESRYRWIMDNSPDIVFSMGADGRITYMSESVERITGWTTNDVVGRRFSDFVPMNELPSLERQFIDQTAEPSVPMAAQVGILARDGRRIPIEVNSQAHVHDGRVVSFHGVAREIGERLRFERELRDQAAAIAASDERARLARELHDSVTQALFSMSLVTRSLELLLDTDPAAAYDKVADLRALQRDALAEMRALVFELRPDGLARDGLISALRTHAAAVTGRMDLPVTIVAHDIERMPGGVEEALYRIAQESIHNVVKHAAATSAVVTITTTGAACLLSVADDGRGFDPASVPPGRMGLAGMLARAERLGGSLAIDSRPGSGTRVTVEVPLEGGST